MLGIIPILLGAVVNNEIIVYAFSVLLFMAIGLLKFKLDKNPKGIMSNHMISIVSVAIAYFLIWAILINLSVL